MRVVEEWHQPARKLVAPSQPTGGRQVRQPPMMTASCEPEHEPEDGPDQEPEHESARQPEHEPDRESEHEPDRDGSQEVQGTVGPPGDQRRTRVFCWSWG